MSDGKSQPLALWLHLHELILRPHVAVEVRHDPERSVHHKRHDQDAERERQHFIGVVGSCRDVQEEYQVRSRRVSRLT
jgi:hypothetical protein